MDEFPKQLPHGEITEIFPDIFFVKGQMEFATSDAIVLLTRAMTVVRDGSDLILINTVRLSEAGLQELDQLGTVRDIVRIGASHGRDDAFYSNRYDLPVWAPEGTNHLRSIKAAVLLTETGPLPIPKASVVLFQTTSEPEAVLLLDQNDGILVTCDCFQNMISPDEFIDDASAKLLKKGGFFRSCNIGPAWRARLKPEKTDFERILNLKFRHLFPSHGDPQLNDAHEVASQTVKEVYWD